MNIMSNKRSIYPPKLEEYIKSSRYIPRKIRKNEHLKIYHRYWLNDYNDAAKVDDIFTENHIEYYSIKYNNMYGCISNPVSVDTYELLYNKNEIEKINIINSSKSYTGAEIKYWFWMNNIDISINSKYSGFWSFLNQNSSNILIDNKYYFVSYNKNRRQKCQMILDKYK